MITSPSFACLHINSVPAANLLHVQKERKVLGRRHICERGGSRKFSQKLERHCHAIMACETTVLYCTTTLTLRRCSLPHQLNTKQDECLAKVDEKVVPSFIFCPPSLPFRYVRFCSCGSGSGTFASGKRRVSASSFSVRRHLRSRASRRCPRQRRWRRRHRQPQASKTSHCTCRACPPSS
jgi:hypothetical protein